MRVRTKICGITRPGDAVAAAEAGADAIGLVFHDQSPRVVTIEQARRITDSLPPFLTCVALFVDPDAARVRAVLDAVPVDVLQFHGAEAAEFCAAFGRPWIKALRVGSGLDLPAAERDYAGCAALLLDTWQAAKAGGTGTAFDWTLVPAVRSKPLVLAGGLTAENVGAAIARVRPYAVDVSGGVEAAPGRKDSRKMREFIDAVAGAAVQAHG
jgi:phosphoribosylanthranilate isomerase